MSTTTAAVQTHPSRALPAALWVVQIFLAISFGAGGFMKLTQPIEALTAMMAWPGDVPAGLVRFIGAAELTAAVGLILPSLTRVQPRLTVLAAIGLTTVMVFAAVFHLMRGELAMIVTNVVLGVLAGFVAWGREKAAPISSR